jgi:hypothetical protein
MNKEEERKREDERQRRIHQLQYQLLLKKGRVNSLLTKLESLRGDLWLK